MFNKPFRGQVLDKNHQLSRSLLVALLANECSGNVLFDYTENEYNFILSNDAEWASTTDGPAIYLNNGSNISILSDKITLPDTRFSLLIRFKPNTLIGNQTVWSAELNSVDRHSYIRLIDNHIQVCVATGTSDAILNFNDIILNTEDFITIGLSWGQDDNILRAYFNGKKQTQEVSLVGYLENDLNGSIGIGKRFFDNTQNFNGYFSFLYVWDKQLIDADFNFISKDPYTIFNDSLLLYNELSYDELEYRKTEIITTTTIVFENHINSTIPTNVTGSQISIKLVSNSHIMAWLSLSVESNLANKIGYFAININGIDSQYVYQEFIDSDKLHNVGVVFRTPNKLPAGEYIVSAKWYSNEPTELSLYNMSLVVMALQMASGSIIPSSYKDYETDSTNSYLEYEDVDGLPDTLTLINDNHVASFLAGSAYSTSENKELDIGIDIENNIESNIIFYRNSYLFEGLNVISRTDEKLENGLVNIKAVWKVSENCESVVAVPLMIGSIGLEVGNNYTIESSKAIVENRTTNSAVLTDISNLNVNINLLGDSHIIVAMSLTSESQMDYKNGFYTINIDGIDYPVFTQYFKYSYDSQSIVVYCRTIEKLSAGNHIIKGRWCTESNNTLYINNGTLLVLAAEGTFDTASSLSSFSSSVSTTSNSSSSKSSASSESSSESKSSDSSNSTSSESSISSNSSESSISSKSSLSSDSSSSDSSSSKSSDSSSSDSSSSKSSLSSDSSSSDSSSSKSSLSSDSSSSESSNSKSSLSSDSSSSNSSSSNSSSSSKSSESISSDSSESSISISVSSKSSESSESSNSSESSSSNSVSSSSDSSSSDSSSSNSSSSSKSSESISSDSSESSNSSNSSESISSDSSSSDSSSSKSSESSRSSESLSSDSSESSISISSESSCSIDVINSNQIRTNRVFKDNLSTNSNYLIPMDGVSTCIRVTGNSHIIAWLSLSTSIDTEDKKGFFVISINGYNSKVFVHDFDSANEKENIGIVFRTPQKLLPGMYSVKAKWYSQTNTTLYVENITLIAMALETDIGNEIPSTFKQIGSDSTISTDYESVDRSYDSMILKKDSGVTSFLTSSIDSFYNNSNVSVAIDLNNNKIERNLNYRERIKEGMYIINGSDILPSGTIEIDAKWYTDEGNIALAEPLMIASIGMESGYNYSIPYSKSHVDNDSTSSDSITDINSLSTTIELNNDSHIFAALTLSANTTVNEQECYFTININGVDYPVITKFFKVANEKSGAVVFVRTLDRLPSGIYTVKGRWYTESGNTINAENIDLVVFAAETYFDTASSYSSSSESSDSSFSESSESSESSNVSPSASSESSSEVSSSSSESSSSSMSMQFTRVLRTSIPDPGISIYGIVDVFGGSSSIVVSRIVGPSGNVLKGQVVEIDGAGKVKTATENALFGTQFCGVALTSGVPGTTISVLRFGRARLTYNDPTNLNIGAPVKCVNGGMVAYADNLLYKIGEVIEISSFVTFLNKGYLDIEFNLLGYTVGSIT